MQEDAPECDDTRKAWTRGDRRIRVVIGLSLSDEHPDHVSDESKTKEMWNAILDTFKRHAIRNRLTSQQKLYTVTMSEC